MALHPCKTVFCSMKNKSSVFVRVKISKDIHDIILSGENGDPKSS
jgi:hypothetical protein